MIRPNVRLQLLLFSLLVLLSLSCNMPVAQNAEPTQIASPAEDPNAILTQVGEAVAASENGGDIVLELTEGQLSAAANEVLKNQGPETIKNLQVDLKDGLVTVTGQMNQNGIDFPVTIVLSIAVDNAGSPYVTIQEGKLGPFPLPQNILDQLKVQFDQMLKSQINDAAGDTFVKSVSVNDGTILIIAEKR
jgi:hypothetical protein